MIKAEELRIGNWIIYGNPIHNDLPKFKITQIWTDVFWLSDGSHVSINNTNLTGIPLTPEILEKCGFEKTFTKTKLAVDYIDYRMNQFVCFLLPDNRLEVEFWPPHNNINERGYITTVTFMHQLQNLFYALAGQELTINL